MVKKIPPRATSPLEAAAGLFDNPLAGTIKDSAQQIWLAGLGAFSKAQEEGGRVFDALVQEGVSMQRKTQSVAEEKLGAVSAQVSARMAEVGQKVGEASARATGQWAGDHFRGARVESASEPGCAAGRRDSPADR